MRKNRLVPVLVVLIAALLPMACEGPAGPPGPPGNANVISFSFTLNPETLRYNGPVASVGYDVPEITPSVVEGGAVLLYFYEQGTWTALPYTFAYESADLPAVDFTVTLGYAPGHRPAAPTDSRPAVPRRRSWPGDCCRRRCLPE